MSKHEAMMDGDRPVWYGELSHPPFRTFRDEELNAVMERVRSGKSARNALRIKWGIAALCFVVLLAGVAVLDRTSSLHLFTKSSSPATQSGKWSTYAEMESTFSFPSDWEVVRTSNDRLEFISDRGSVGSLTVIQYGLAYSRTFESHYPPNSKIIETVPDQAKSEQERKDHNIGLIGPQATHMRFQLYTTEGEPGFIEDHYYFMQALVTYDFAFRSDWVDQQTADVIAESFVYTGKLPSNPCESKNVTCDYDK
ncbi:hypothetical protein [Cohnella luojiensis]|uniref:Uncharacterized protein n=1 Tax=Cohnella luojiensis TaxID=652876 RepID=A0A4Y8M4S5_9BACL|nr:hypothetical protein [Cohnella luojiensis]TFE30666.1 hypothetical protein E2980_02460 [Cohnella luojiensis]